MVHDLIHTRSGGTWSQRVSSYPKLRISPAWLTGQCRAAGLDILHGTTTPSGLSVIAAAKPAKDRR